jgi:hypothetical protein
MVGLFLFRVLVLDRVETPFYHTRLYKIANPLSINFGNQLSLIGFEFLHGTAFSADQTLEVTLYWRVLTPLAINYQTGIQLVDREGNRFGQSDNQNPAGLPTSRWRPDQYGRDEHLLLPLSGTPPGEYHLLVSAYALQDNAISHLSWFNGDAPAGIEYDLGAVTITRAKPEPPGPVRLVEAALTTEAIGVGERLTFTTLWNSGDDPLPPLSAQLQFLASQGRKTYTATFPPASADYSTDQWSQNELVRYPHSLILPPDLPPGLVRVTLALLDGDGNLVIGPHDLGELTITIPERTFAIPAISHMVNRDFNNSIRLLGYNIAPGRITLYWQSLRPVTIPLTVFVHAFGENSAFIAGHDSPPPRITTSWLPNEVIVDPHPIDVGRRFEIGLYDPATGERFGEIYIQTTSGGP